jgi:hypothetical protein
MPEHPETWHVIYDEEPVAGLTVELVARFWRHGKVSRRERFEVLVARFAREARLATTIGTTPGWWEAYEEMRQQIRLIRPGGHEGPEFILHIDGPGASWRCVEPITEPRLEGDQ